MLGNLAKNKNTNKKTYLRNTSELDECKNMKNSQIEEAQQTPTVINTKKSKVRYFLVNMLKTKERKNLEGKSKRKAK